MAEARAVIPKKLLTEEQKQQYLTDKKITDTYEPINKIKKDGKIQQATAISKLEPKDSIPVIIRTLIRAQDSLKKIRNPSEEIQKTIATIDAALTVFSETDRTLNLGGVDKAKYLYALNPDDTIAELQELVGLVSNVTLTVETKDLWDEVALWLEGIYRRTADKIKKGPKPCELLQTAESVSADNYTEIAAKLGNNKSRAAYLRCGNSLFYLDQDFGTFTSINLDASKLVEFDKQFKPAAKKRDLTEKELKQMTALTGHVHSLVPVPLREKDGCFPRVDILEDGVLFKATKYKLTKMEVSLYYFHAASALKERIKSFDPKKVITQSVPQPVVVAPAPQPVVVEVPAPQPVVVQAPAPQPVVVQVPAPQPVVVQAPAQQPVVVEVPAPQPVVAEAPAQQPVVVAPAQQPVVAEVPAQQPVVVQAPAPQPVVVQVPAPQPVVVAPAAKPVVVEAPATQSEEEVIASQYIENYVRFTEDDHNLYYDIEVSEAQKEFLQEISNVVNDMLDNPLVAALRKDMHSSERTRIANFQAALKKHGLSESQKETLANFRDDVIAAVKRYKKEVTAWSHYLWKAHGSEADDLIKTLEDVNSDAEDHLTAVLKMHCELYGKSSNHLYPYLNAVLLTTLARLCPKGMNQELTGKTSIKQADDGNLILRIEVAKGREEFLQQICEMVGEMLDNPLLALLKKDVQSSDDQLRLSSFQAALQRFNLNPIQRDMLVNFRDEAIAAIERYKNTKDTWRSVLFNKAHAGRADEVISNLMASEDPRDHLMEIFKLHKDMYSQTSVGLFKNINDLLLTTLERLCPRPEEPAVQQQKKEEAVAEKQTARKTESEASGFYRLKK